MSKYYITINASDLTSYLKSNGLSWTEITHYVERYQKQIYKSSSIGDIARVRQLQDELFCNKKTSLLAMRYMLNRKFQYQVKSKQRSSDFLFVDPPIFMHLNFFYEFAGKDNKILTNLTIHELLLIILRPEWEARIELNSYGFSSSLAINQAVIKTYSILSENKIYDNSTILVGKANNWLETLDVALLLKKSNYSGYIKSYFLSICHKSLFLSLSTLTNKKFQSVDIIGFPYNSIALVLSNIIFYGLEMAVSWEANNLEKAHLGKITTIVCSDHFLIIFPCSNIHRISLAINCIRSFLKSIGLVLQNSSLNAQSIQKGFDFLGFNFRRQTNEHSCNNQETKLIIKPTSNNIKKHLLSMRHCLYHKDRLNRWRANAQMTQYDVINKLNPIITDFSHYYTDLVPITILKLLDKTLNEVIYRYAIKKYKSNRSKKWNDNWNIVFHGKKVIAYKDDVENSHKPLYLHTQKRSKAIL